MFGFPLRRWALAGGLCLALVAADARAQGIGLTGVGPINRAMGGAATAAPIDAAGALHWNPGAISGLQRSEVTFGVEMLLPTMELSSQFGPAAGTTGGEPGVTPIPSVAWVQKMEGTPFTIGLGLFGIGGFRTNYARDPNNPILNAQPFPPGFGRVYSEAEFQQLVPTLSYALNENLSIGIAPTLTIARVALDPLLVAPPVAGQYTSGRGTRYHWGGGFQIGAYYTDGCGQHLGLSVKSPQWMEPFRFKTEGAGGTGREVTYKIDYPLIVSLGWAYSAIENYVLAVDVRYTNYKDADGFGAPAAIAPQGNVLGLGWDDLISVHTGLQYKYSDCLYLRLGYAFQENPVDASNAFFNFATPLIVEHIASIGATYMLAPTIGINAAYLHGFENSVTGPYPVGAGTVTSEVSADALVFGVTVQY